MPADQRPTSSPNSKKTVSSKGSPAVKTTGSLVQGKGKEKGEKIETESSSSEDKQGIFKGASGDSMAPAPINEDDINYGKGKSIPPSPSGLV